jgi:nitrate/nitrite transport system permease protein
MLALPRFFEPYARLIKGEQPDVQLKAILHQIGYPLLGILAFLFLWSQVASNITTSLGKFPDPQSVYTQAQNLWSEHKEDRIKEQKFYERQEKRNAKKLEKNPDYQPKIRPYTGAPTFIDQIVTSLITVMAGFLLSAVIAIPLGILIGLNQGLNRAFNPVIQVFKPVSPLAWLPLVTMLVSALYVTDDPMFAKSFLNSMITVTLCSLWPTLINTAIGVASVEKDLVNVSRVLRLNSLVHVQKIVLPSSLPMIFTGLRLSLGVAWMVLIAAEMLAQNPGLGKFVWDEFQNGSSSSLSRIMVAVITIGFIGLILDKSMLVLQNFFSWEKNSNTV